MSTTTLPRVTAAPTARRWAVPLQFAAIVLFAAVYCLPCLIHGLPLAGDSLLHTTLQHQFSGQFWSGEFYPRWIASANHGYGSPVFLIQYPLPYWITALVRPLSRFAATPVRESRELGIFCFLSLAVAGVNARIWLRTHVSLLAATIAAIGYISLPYVLPFELYTDFALGQFLVFAWLPLALAACDALDLRLRALCALGAVWALLVLSNLLTALLTAPFVVLYAFARWRARRRSLGRCALALTLSLTLGSCCAGIYLLPFFAYLRLFNVAALLALPGYEISHYLCYVRADGLTKPVIVAALLVALLVAAAAAYAAWRRAENVVLRVCMLATLVLGVLMMIPGLGPWLIGMSGLKPPVFPHPDYFPERLMATSLLTIALGVFAYSVAPRKSAGPRDWTHPLLLVTACIMFLSMLGWTASLWHSAALVATAVQFPHRLGVVMTIAVTGLLAPAIDGFLQSSKRGQGRLIVISAAVGLAVIAGGIATWRADWRWYQDLRSQPLVHEEETEIVDRTYRTYVSADHVNQFARLIGDAPADGTSLPTLPDPVKARVIDGGGEVTVTRLNARRVLISYFAPQEARAQIGLLYSPLWTIVSTDGAATHLRVGNSPAGLIEVPLGAGRHALVLAFDVGWPERYGLFLTIVAIGIVVVGLFDPSLRSKAQEPPAPAAD